jgi:S-adenosyl methyltransferase
MAEDNGKKRAAHLRWASQYRYHQAQYRPDMRLLRRGKENFPADREFARRAMEVAPKAPLAAQNNRAFLRRVVRYLVAEARTRGRQFSQPRHDVRHGRFHDNRVTLIVSAATVRVRRGMRT